MVERGRAYGSLGSPQNRGPARRSDRTWVLWKYRNQSNDAEEKMRTHSAVTIIYMLVALSAVDRSVDVPPMYIEHAHTGLSVGSKSDLAFGLSHPIVNALEPSQPVFDS